MHTSTTHHKTVLFLILLFLYSFSQEVTAERKFPEFCLGFSGGLNIASMFGSDIDELGKRAYQDAGVRAAGNGNVTLTCMFNRALAVQTGVWMTGKGFRILLDSYSGSAGEAKLFMKRSVTYIEFPLLLKAIYSAKTSKNSGYAIHFFAGGAVNKVVSANEYLYAKYVYKNPYTGAITGRETEDIEELDLMPDRELTDTLGNNFHYTFGDFYGWNDIMFILGMTIEKRFYGSGIFIEVQYNQGLLNFNHLSDHALKTLERYNIPDTSPDVTVEQYEAMFRTFSINLGVRIYIREIAQKSRKQYQRVYSPGKR